MSNVEIYPVVNGVFIDNAKNIIFNHDFAKAFWGEGEKCNCAPMLMGLAGIGHQESCDVVKYPNWQTALQRMVLQIDTIKYLENFLDADLS